jgi:SAM-dependent methyltransferase
MDLACPRCSSELPPDDGVAIPCPGCGAAWPVVAGIPDLRVFPDPYIEILEDREKAVVLDHAARTRTPDELVAFYFSITPEVPPGHAAAHQRGILRLGPARAQDRIGRLSRDVPLFGRHPRVLDLGCGAGAWLPALAPRAGSLVALDVGLRWLVIARHRLRALGIEATFVCGNAEALPLRAHSVDVVVAANVIEHARDAERGLSEVFRVLDKDGYAYFASPNRFSLLPEPHVRLPGLGLLPRRVADELVRRARGVPYGAITLRGTLGWIDLVSGAGFRRVEVTAAVPGGRERAELGPLEAAAARGLAAARSLPGGDLAMKAFGPLLEVHAFKGPNRERIPVGRAAD